MADLGAERLQGIVYRNPYRAHRPNQTAFADTFGAEPSRCLGCLDMVEHDVGHLGRHRDEIVGHRSVQQIGVVAVDALFKSTAPMPCTIPPRTCSSTRSGLITRPQSSTAHWPSILMKPVSQSTST